MCFLHFKRTLTVPRQNPSEPGSPTLSCLLTGKQSSESSSLICDIRHKTVFHQAQTVFLKGCKGNMKISKLFLSNIRDYLPAALRFLTSQSNQSFIFCELRGTFPTQKGTLTLSQDAQGASDQEVRQRIELSHSKNLFSLIPLHISHEYFPRRPNFEADGQDRILTLLAPGKQRCHMVL